VTGQYTLNLAPLLWQGVPEQAVSGWATVILNPVVTQSTPAGLAGVMAAMGG